MIVFDLKCENQHVFEAWFASSSAFEDQRDRALVECPECGSRKVMKAIMAPNVAAKGNQKTVSRQADKPTIAPSPLSPAVPTPAAAPSQAGLPDPVPAELKEAAQQFFGKLKSHVEANCDYVGDEFAEEARKIHYGEADARGIYGEATPDDTQDLLDEGIEILPLPGVRRTDA